MWEPPSRLHDPSLRPDLRGLITRGKAHLHKFDCVCCGAHAGQPCLHKRSADCPTQKCCRACRRMNVAPESKVEAPKPTRPRWCLRGVAGGVTFEWDFEDECRCGAWLGSDPVAVVAGDVHLLFCDRTCARVRGYEETPWESKQSIEEAK